VKKMDVVGAVTGIVGTFLLSTHWAAMSDYRFAAFCLYAVSNFCMICVGLQKKVGGLVLMQAVYMVFTMNGLWNNWPGGVK
jgi:hypothetical protein